MKYIRTKDGIYKATEINGMIVARGGVVYSCDIADVHYPIVFKEKDIIKQADTIEELIDEYIVDETAYKTFGRKKPYLSEYNFHKWVDEIDFAYECGVNLYLGIWIDGELRKVAKMNDKGELELL